MAYQKKDVEVPKCVVHDFSTTKNLLSFLLTTFTIAANLAALGFFDKKIEWLRSQKSLPR